MTALSSLLLIFTWLAHRIVSSEILNIFPGEVLPLNTDPTIQALLTNNPGNLKLDSACPQLTARLARNQGFSFMDVKNFMTGAVFPASQVSGSQSSFFCYTDFDNNLKLRIFSENFDSHKDYQISTGQIKGKLTFCSTTLDRKVSGQVNLFCSFVTSSTENTDESVQESHQTILSLIITLTDPPKGFEYSMPLHYRNRISSSSYVYKSEGYQLYYEQWGPSFQQATSSIISFILPADPDRKLDSQTNENALILVDLKKQTKFPNHNEVLKIFSIQEAEGSSQNTGYSSLFIAVSLGDNSGKVKTQLVLCSLNRDLPGTVAPVTDAFTDCSLIDITTHSKLDPSLILYAQVEVFSTRTNFVYLQTRDSIMQCQVQQNGPLENCLWAKVNIDSKYMPDRLTLEQNSGNQDGDSFIQSLFVLGSDTSSITQSCILDNNFEGALANRKSKKSKPDHFKGVEDGDSSCYGFFYPVVETYSYGLNFLAYTENQVYLISDLSHVLVFDSNAPASISDDEKYTLQSCTISFLLTTKPPLAFPFKKPREKTIAQSFTFNMITSVPDFTKFNQTILDESQDLSVSLAYKKDFDSVLPFQKTTLSSNGLFLYFNRPNDQSQLFYSEWSTEVIILSNQEVNKDFESPKDLRTVTSAVLVQRFYIVSSQTTPYTLSLSYCLRKNGNHLSCDPYKNTMKSVSDLNLVRIRDFYRCLLILADSQTDLKKTQIILFDYFTLKLTTLQEQDTGTIMDFYCTLDADCYTLSTSGPKSSQLNLFYLDNNMQPQQFHVSDFSENNEEIMEARFVFTDNLKVSLTLTDNKGSSRIILLLITTSKTHPITLRNVIKLKKTQDEYACSTDKFGVIRRGVGTNKQKLSLFDFTTLMETPIPLPITAQWPQELEYSGTMCSDSEYFMVCFKDTSKNYYRALLLKHTVSVNKLDVVVGTFGNSSSSNGFPILSFDPCGPGNFITDDDNKILVSTADRKYYYINDNNPLFVIRENQGQSSELSLLNLRSVDPDYNQSPKLSLSFTPGDYAVKTKSVKLDFTLQSFDLEDVIQSGNIYSLRTQQKTPFFHLQPRMEFLTSERLSEKPGLVRFAGGDVDGSSAMLLVSSDASQNDQFLVSLGGGTQTMLEFNFWGKSVTDFRLYNYQDRSLSLIILYYNQTKSHNDILTTQTENGAMVIKDTTQVYTCAKSITCFYDFTEGRYIWVIKQIKEGAYTIIQKNQNTGERHSFEIFDIDHLDCFDSEYNFFIAVNSKDLGDTTLGYYMIDSNNPLNIPVISTLEVGFETDKLTAMTCHIPEDSLDSLQARPQTQAPSNQDSDSTSIDCYFGFINGTISRVSYSLDTVSSLPSLRPSTRAPFYFSQLLTYIPRSISLYDSFLTVGADAGFSNRSLIQYYLNESSPFIHSEVQLEKHEELNYCVKDNVMSIQSVCWACANRDQGVVVDNYRMQHAKAVFSKSLADTPDLKKISILINGESVNIGGLLKNLDDSSPFSLILIVSVVTLGLVGCFVGCICVFRRNYENEDPYFEGEEERERKLPKTEDQKKYQERQREQFQRDLNKSYEKNAEDRNTQDFLETLV